MPPVVHPGIVLLGEMLERDGSLTDMARQIGADRELLRDVVQQHGDVTPELAELLAKGTDIDAAFWLRVQRRYDANEPITLEPSTAPTEEEVATP